MSAQTQVIQGMTRVEKVQLMEALWQDLSAPKAEYESPAWHEKALAETEAEINAGTAKFMDWELAKEELRKAVK